MIRLSRNMPLVSLLLALVILAVTPTSAHAVDQPLNWELFRSNVRILNPWVEKWIDDRAPNGGKGVKFSQDNRFISLHTYVASEGGGKRSFWVNYRYSKGEYEAATKFIEEVTNGKWRNFYRPWVIGQDPDLFNQALGLADYYKNVIVPEAARAGEIGAAVALGYYQLFTPAGLDAAIILFDLADQLSSDSAQVALNSMDVLTLTVFFTKHVPYSRVSKARFRTRGSRANSEIDGDFLLEVRDDLQRADAAYPGIGPLGRLNTRSRAYIEEVKRVYNVAEIRLAPGSEFRSSSVHGNFDAKTRVIKIRQGLPPVKETIIIVHELEHAQHFTWIGRVPSVGAQLTIKALSEVFAYQKQADQIKIFGITQAHWGGPTTTAVLQARKYARQFSKNFQCFHSDAEILQATKALRDGYGADRFYSVLRQYIPAGEVKKIAAALGD